MINRQPAFSLSLCLSVCLSLSLPLSISLSIYLSINLSYINSFLIPKESQNSWNKMSGFPTAHCTLSRSKWKDSSKLSQRSTFKVGTSFNSIHTHSVEHSMKLVGN